MAATKQLKLATRPDKTGRVAILNHLWRKKNSKQKTFWVEKEKEKSISIFSGNVFKMSQKFYFNFLLTFQIFSLFSSGETFLILMRMERIFWHKHNEIQTKYKGTLETSLVLYQLEFDKCTRGCYLSVSCTVGLWVSFGPGLAPQLSAKPRL